MSPGIRISHYTVIEPLGPDGAADTYRARDMRLEREVALKVLRPGTPADVVERFRREARIASLVTHPHIRTVHESGEENGQAYLVCELLEGQTLEELLAAGPLPPDRVLDAGIQLLDALAAVHRRGVVHADLAPANVFITAEGHLKLLALGAAAAVADLAPVGADAEDSSPTRSAALQADERGDIVAAGALLDRMAPGNRPKSLDSIIARALHERAEDGYTAAGMLEDLRRARHAPQVPPRFGSGWRAQRVAIRAAIAAVVVAAMGAAWWWTSTKPAGERRAVLVSQIANGTGDPDFDGTLREAAMVYLAQSPYLDLASDERIRRTLQLMGRDPAAPMTHAVAADACQRLGLQAMLEGSVSAVGARTVIALVATDCRTGAEIAKQQREVTRKEDVLRAVGELTSTMRESLGESGATLANNNVPIEEATTPSLDALKAYTEAAAQRAAGAEPEAVKLLERAVSIDPRFALAYTTLSSIYGGFGETGRSQEYARLAYEQRDRVSERERLFITYQYHDSVTGDQRKAREALEVWKRTYPLDYRPANALAVLLNRLGDYAGAATEAGEAMRRNPAHAFPRSNLAHAYRGAGRFAEARAVAEKALAENLETNPMRRLLFQLAELEGDHALAQRQIEATAGRRRSFDITGARAQIAAFHGRIAEARTLYAETIATAQDRGFSQVASGYASQGALTEVLYGYRGAALAQARTILRSASAYEPQLRAATALALAGQPGDAEALAKRLRHVRPDDTLLHNAYLPVTEAAALLARGRHDAVVEQLRRAAPYEHGMIAALLPIYLRGEARLRAGSLPGAVREFETILARRGADLFSPVVVLARLGLARAHARAGDVAASRRAYEELLAVWRNADEEFPVLRQAREELARLPRNVE